MILPSSLVISQGWGLIDLPLRASNEGLLRPRVARAQKIIRLHPPPLLREQGINTGVIPPLLSCAFCEQGSAHLSYSIPAILLADSTVLSSNIAIVIGPTPPGTGLIQPAF